MARHGDTRSPSPVGSSYSSSKRIRRPDDHYDRSKRDDARSYKRRSRSRSPDVRHTGSYNRQIDAYSVVQRRYRDRDSHRRRDRSTDRRDEDYYRSSRRDKSRDRRRSRDRDIVKDYRRRSRARDTRDRRDNSRDRTRRHRDGSTDSKRTGRREDSRDRTSSRIAGADKREVRLGRAHA